MMSLALLPLGAALWLGLGDRQWWPLAVLLTMSLLTVAAYAWDKRQAVRGEWRIPESRLHLLELCGGWPGALGRTTTLAAIATWVTRWWLGRTLWQQ